jgi:hypothetical protein
METIEIGAVIVSAGNLNESWIVLRSRLGDAGA